MNLVRAGSAARKAVRGAYQFVQDSWLDRGMPGIGHDVQLGFWPGAMQIPRAAHRADHVVASLHDHRRDMPDGAGVAQQLVFVLEEAAVDEVVALDARERRGELLASRFSERCSAGSRADSSLQLSQIDQARAASSSALSSLAGESLVVSGAPGPSALRRKRRQIVLPRIGEHRAAPPCLVEPVESPSLSQQENAAQHQLGARAADVSARRRAPVC